VKGAKIKGRGFTLIELLVVIAVIALLMSILGPSLSMTRKKAKAVACQSRLKQWGHVFSTYTVDNDSHFMNGRVSRNDPYWWPAGEGGGVGSWWFLVLEPYYKDATLRLCPIATKPYQEGGRAPFAAWLTFLGDSGSYGANGYIVNSPVGLAFQLGRSTDKNWRTINVRGGANIPLFLDCLYVDGWPQQCDVPQDTGGWWEDVLGEDEMRRFCISRHEGCINGVFFDSSVRKIGLKELWKLKWHRGYDVNGAPPDWPRWMASYLRHRQMTESRGRKSP
jgi:prepilin-type N-terminal cleavage/methylation domain-containing protein